MLKINITILFIFILLLDINPRIRSAKENMHQEEIVAQSKSYEFLEKSDVQISLGEFS